MLPVAGTATPVQVSSGFAHRIDPVNGGGQFHPGLDIGGAEGTALIAIADGEIHYTNGASYSESAGYYVVMKYPDHINGGDLYVRYLHMTHPCTLSRGDAITKGQGVGFLGNTGWSTGPHLHLEFGKVCSRYGALTERFDPAAYYPSGYFINRHTGENLPIG